MDIVIVYWSIQNVLIQTILSFCQSEFIFKALFLRKWYFTKYQDSYLAYLQTHIFYMQFFNFEPLISFLAFIFSFHQLWCTSFDQALRNFWLKALLLKKWHMKLKRHHDIICINKTNTYMYLKFLFYFSAEGFLFFFFLEKLNYPNAQEHLIFNHFSRKV